VTRRLLHRFLRAKPRLDLGKARHLAVGLFGQGANLVGGHVAGHHQDRIVWRVEAAIELERAFAVELFDFMPPADHRPAIGVVQVERGIHLFAQPRRGIVGDPHVLLFQHDVELGPHHVVGERQPGHPVGLEFHHGLELVARHPLEITGVVGRGECVLLAADGGNDLGEAPGRVLVRALEHQMFEEMGKPRFARRLVGGADLVPDHMGHDRRAVIGNDDHLETVGQGEMADLGGTGEGGRHSAGKPACDNCKRGQGGQGFEQDGVLQTSAQPASSRANAPRPLPWAKGWSASRNTMWRRSSPPLASSLGAVFDRRCLALCIFWSESIGLGR
jgi:hypothetical protein